MKSPITFSWPGINPPDLRPVRIRTKRRDMLLRPFKGELRHVPAGTKLRVTREDLRHLDGDVYDVISRPAKR